MERSCRRTFSISPVGVIRQLYFREHGIISNYSLKNPDPPKPICLKRKSIQLCTTPAKKSYRGNESTRDLLQSHKFVEYKRQNLNVLEELGRKLLWTRDYWTIRLILMELVRNPNISFKVLAKSVMGEDEKDVIVPGTVTGVLAVYLGFVKCPNKLNQVLVTKQIEKALILGGLTICDCLSKDHDADEEMDEGNLLKRLVIDEDLLEQKQKQKQQQQPRDDERMEVTMGNDNSSETNCVNRGLILHIHPATDNAPEKVKNNNNNNDDDDNDEDGFSIDTIDVFQDFIKTHQLDIDCLNQETQLYVYTQNV